VISCDEDDRGSQVATIIAQAIAFQDNWRSHGWEPGARIIFANAQTGDIGDGLSWCTGYRSIENALSAASDVTGNAEVCVAGYFDETPTLDQPVTLWSLNGSAVIGEASP
jgi:hypothetical protein